MLKKKPHNQNYVVEKIRQVHKQMLLLYHFIILLSMVCSIFYKIRQYAKINKTTHRPVKQFFINRSCLFGIFLIKNIAYIALYGITKLFIPHNFDYVVCKIFLTCL